MNTSRLNGFELVEMHQQFADVLMLIPFLLVRATATARKTATNTSPLELAPNSKNIFPVKNGGYSSASSRLGYTQVGSMDQGVNMYLCR
jgi:hypothetical protein